MEVVVVVVVLVVLVVVLVLGSRTSNISSVVERA